MEKIFLVLLSVTFFSSVFADYRVEQVNSDLLDNKAMTVTRVKDVTDNNFCYILETKDGNTNMQCVTGLR